MNQTSPRHEVLKAAWLKANSAMTQRELGEKGRLGTQAQVSKLLSEARERGILREVFQFPPDYPEEERRIIEQSFFPRHDELESALAERSRELADERRGGTSPFKVLHVVPTPDQGKSPDEGRRIYGQGAAEVVAEYIDQTDTCTVAWGNTLQATLDLVREHNGPRNAQKRFIPIAGDPTNFKPNGVSPSDAAELLRKRWPGSDALSLRGLQARIPRFIAVRDPDGFARELVEFSNAYREIFVGDDGAKPLMAGVGMILTGIGVGANTDDPWFAETSVAEGREALDLAHGNIGGIWIPRPDLSSEDLRRIEEMNERWLGAKLEHVVRCSRGADLARGRPGVVVLAAERSKAEIILEALDLINVLIVSYPLAEELKDRLLPERDE